MNTNSNKSQSVTMQNQPFTFLFHEKQKDEKGRRKSVAGIVKDNKLYLGVSTCGPRDQFNRKLGRTIAIGRAEKCPSKTLELQNETDTRQTFFDALKSL